jgi:hypothetical protein
MSLSFCTDMDQDHRDNPKSKRLPVNYHNNEQSIPAADIFVDTRKG